MSMFRSSNPAFSERALSGFNSFDRPARAMTVQGAVNKTGILLALLVGAASWTWHLAYSAASGTSPSASGALGGLMLLGIVGSLIAYFATIFKMNWSPVTAPIYAVCEGLMIGALSAMFEASSHGIVIRAVGLTFAVLAIMLIAYTTGLIRVTQKFRMVVTAAIGAICLYYIVMLVLRLFGVMFESINDSSPLSIGISLVIVAVASLSLVLQFDFVESLSLQGAPKYMEWYAGFGLMVALVWLYLEILRLLAKLNNRR